MAKLGWRDVAQDRGVVAMDEVATGPGRSRRPAADGVALRARGLLAEEDLPAACPAAAVDLGRVREPGDLQGAASSSANGVSRRCRARSHAAAGLRLCAK